MYFISHDFGEREGSGLRGRAWLGACDPPSPLSGVQVAARNLKGGKITYAVTSADGRFTVDPIAPGDYEVWTCLDGFDELRFRLHVDPKSTTVGFELFLSPSETSGRHDIVPISSSRVDSKAGRDRHM